MSAEQNRERSKPDRILVVTAVEAEKKAILDGWIGRDSADHLDVITAGVGPVAAAVGTMKRLHERSYDLVINCGIAGGFPHYAEVGSVVLATEIIAADLGAETPEGFSRLEELGFGQSRIAIPSKRYAPIEQRLRGLDIPIRIGPILTVSTVTGTGQTAKRRAEQTKGVLAEAMEGFGVALAAQAYHLPMLEIRTISNAVGPRDRSQWKVKEALLALTKVGQAIAEFERRERSNNG